MSATDPPDSDRASLRRLVEQDTGLPGLGVLLDPSRLLEAVSAAFPGLDPVAGRRNYTRYKFATNCLCMYEIERADGVRELLTAKAFSPDNSHKRSKTLRALDEGSAHAALAEPHLEFVRLPFDPKLPALRTLYDDAKRPALLRDVFPDEPERHDGTATLLAYKPERRAVTRFVDTQGRSVSLKIHTERRHEDSSRRLIRLVSRGPLRLPRRVASSSGHGIVVAEWLEGDLLAELLADDAFDSDTLRRVGHGLAALQTQDPQHLEIHRPAQQASALIAMSGTLAILDPELGRRAAPLCERTAARLECEPVDAFPIHGDFYAKQVLLSPDAVSFIDLDAAGRGSAFEDIGCFLAHLDRDVVRGRFSQSRAEEAGERLVDALAEANPGLPAEGRVLQHVTGLCSLLADPFRRNEDGWLGSAHALLDRVEQLEASLTHRQRFRRANDSKAPSQSATEDASPDEKIPTLGPALDTARAARAIQDTAFPHAEVGVVSAELVRHKPGRRALIDYRLSIDDGSTGAAQRLRVLGKLRRRRIDFYAYRLACELHRVGFAEGGHGHVVTPKPMGLVLELQLWLQRFEDGADAGDLLLGAEAPQLAARIAQALQSVHAAPLHCVREQTLADELDILEKQLGDVREARPNLAAEIQGALEQARQLAGRMETGTTTGIHRDFHPHQILVRKDALVLLDFDLFAEGDPLLDAGNFAAHLQELAIRERGSLDGLAETQSAFEEAFLACSPASDARELSRHRALAFLRHVAISHRIEARRLHTETILAAAREQLAGLL